MSKLKEKLLALEEFIDNEWLDKYVSLIQSNKTTKREAFKTQSHHIIPKCYYALNKIDVDNSKDNKVNLTFVDHALAHLYLANCISNQQLKHRNMKAVDHVVGNINFKTCDSYEVERELITNSELYASTYAQTKEFWSKTCNLHDPNVQSKEQRSLNGKQNRGRRHLYKGDEHRFVHDDEYDELLLDGWVEKNFNSEIHAGRKHMWKDDVQLSVKPEDIERRLAEGFVFGDKPGSNSHTHKCKSRLGVSPSNAIKVLCIEKI